MCSRTDSAEWPATPSLKPFSNFLRTTSGQQSWAIISARMQLVCHTAAHSRQRNFQKNMIMTEVREVTKFVGKNLYWCFKKPTLFAGGGKIHYVLNIYFMRAGCAIRKVCQLGKWELPTAGGFLLPKQARHCTVGQGTILAIWTLAVVCLNLSVVL